MIHNSLIAVAVVLCTLLVEASAALAADPSQIGKHAEDIVTPNVKSFYRIGVIVGVLALLFFKPKGSLVAAALLAMVISGVVIFNTSGFTDTITSIGNKLL